MATKDDGRPHHEAATQKADEAVPRTVPDRRDSYPVDWREALARRVAATVGRRERRKDARREFGLARHHGLAARHAAKQRRTGGGRR